MYIYIYLVELLFAIALSEVEGAKEEGTKMILMQGWLDHGD